jgi:hypothetical protein
LVDFSGGGDELDFVFEVGFVGDGEDFEGEEGFEAVHLGLGVSDHDGLLVDRLVELFDEGVAVCVLIAGKQKNDFDFRLVFHFFSNYGFGMLVQILVLVGKLLYYVDFPHFFSLDELIFVLFDSGMSGFFGDVFGFSGGNFTITFFGI